MLLVILRSCDKGLGNGRMLRADVLLAIENMKRFNQIALWSCGEVQLSDIDKRFFELRLVHS